MSQSVPYYILFDSETSQVERQAATGTRLNTLYGALTSVFGVSGAGGAQNPLKFTSVSAGNYAPITSSQLEGVKVLAILTRWKFGPPPSSQPSGYAPFSPAEISAIQQYVSGGGGLLLMSNHGPFALNPTQTPWSLNDAALAKAFGFKLSPIAILNPKKGLLTMQGSNFQPSSAPQIFSGVSSVLAHNGCGIKPTGTNTQWLIQFPSGSEINTPNLPSTGQYPSGMYFAATGTYGTGKVVVVANSGIIGDAGNKNPAPGLAPFNNNLFFVLNSFAWLAGIPAWSPFPSGPLNGG